MKLNPTGSPPETKVVAQTNIGVLSGVISWIFTAYIFKGHLDPQLSALLPVLISTALGTGAGWFAKHTPRLDEVARQITEAYERQYPQRRLLSPDERASYRPPTRNPNPTGTASSSPSGDGTSVSGDFTSNPIGKGTPVVSPATPAPSPTGDGTPDAGYWSDESG